MNPWTLLDLEPGSDTRSIKRRYAQLLKVHRPDEDPVAFQRLREAYERALALADQETLVDAGPEPAFAWQKMQPEVLETPAYPDEGVIAERPAPVFARQEQQATELESPGYPLLDDSSDQTERMGDQALIDNLLASSESLDEALRVAGEQGLQRALQLALLSRCLGDGAQAMETLRWSMQRLKWLTPWQESYLPAPAMEMLAARLMDDELQRIAGVLQEKGDESGFYEGFRALLESRWMQSLERRARLQQRLLQVLEEGEGGSPELLARLGGLFGWSEAQGYLPQDHERWERLEQRHQLAQAKREVRETLARRKPKGARQNAIWFLLGPLSDGRRRRMADRFNEEDWQACWGLARELHMQLADLPHELQLSYCEDWRDWVPKNWSGPAFIYVSALTAVVIAMLLSDRQSLLGLSLAPLVGCVLTFILRFFLKLYLLVVYELAAVDVWLSRWLIPKKYSLRGAGLLLLRHVVPAAAFSLLTGHWASELGVRGIVSVLTFVASMGFLLLVMSGADPLGWWWRFKALAKAFHLKWILFWGVLIVGVCVWAANHEQGRAERKERAAKEFCKSAPDAFRLTQCPQGEQQ